MRIYNLEDVEVMYRHVKEAACPSSSIDFRPIPWKRAVGPHDNDPCEYTEVLEMLAYPHTLEDLFQRSGFTRQRLFDGLRRHLFAGTPYLRCQRAGVPSTAILNGVSSSGNDRILPPLTGGRAGDCA
jgi:hypothetical protein